MSKDETNALDYGRVPPQAVEVEEVVLGAVMIESDAIEKVYKVLQDDTFYRNSHQIIWRAIRMLYEDGAPIDLVTVTEQLKRNGELEDAGGAHYVSQLTNKVGSAANIAYHAKILTEKFIQRQLITRSTEIIKDAYEDSTDVIELAELAANNFMEILKQIAHHRKKKLSDVLTETFDDIRSRINGERTAFFKTGWIEFDNIICLDKPRIIVVPSNRKIGKTAFMIALMRQVILHNTNTAWIFFTLEMPAAACVRRLISIETGLTDEQILSKNYKLTGPDKEAIKAAKTKIESFPIEFEEKCTGILDFKVKCEMFCKEHEGKDCFIVIDNHGYIVDKAENEESICKEYVNIRTNTNSVIFVLHHLTTKGIREFNIENGYEPNMDMIRGNTRLIDYCNTLLLLHRPDLYKDLMYKLKLELKPELFALVKKLFLVSCALNRDGDTGYARLQHQIKYSQFKPFHK